MICPKCGTEAGEGNFCSQCGAAVSEQAQQQEKPVVPRQEPTWKAESFSEEYKPISMWGYFGYELLFAIPCIGQICLIVLSITASNRNVKNFARSYFCLVIIIVVLVLLVSLSRLGGISRLINSLT